MKNDEKKQLKAKIVIIEKRREIPNKSKVYYLYNKALRSYIYMFTWSLLLAKRMDKIN